jgi:hypothetical protein
MIDPRRIGRHEALGRDLYLAVVDELRDWPDEIDQPVPPFVVLTALDTAGVSNGELGEFAGKVLDQGGCYATAWGDDADRMHLAFDTEFIDREQLGKVPWRFVITTSQHDSLDEALWYALFVAFPADVEAQSVLVVTNRRWAEAIERRLSDPEQLSRDVLADENGARE